MSQFAFHPRKLDGLWDVGHSPVADHRGVLQKLYDAGQFGPLGDLPAWVQVIVSRTAKAKTLRGLHLQAPPFVEAKLVAPLLGRMVWVAVDVRRASPSFGQWESTTLDADHPTALYAARGFAHGCLSLTEDADLLILADNAYAEGLGIRWDDPDLAIDWPLAGPPTLSQAHTQLPSFAAFREVQGGI